MHRRFAIVTARFNSLVTGALLDGAIETLLSHGVPPHVTNIVKTSNRSFACYTKGILRVEHQSLPVLCLSCAARQDIVSAWVPGAFELGVVAKNMAASGRFDAVICLGAIIRGDTSHYDAVVSAATSGVQNASSATGQSTPECTAYTVF
jgi:6,7-dimethyl-8-ribityllumazine synthase